MSNDPLRLAPANYLGHLIGALLATSSGFRARPRLYLLAALAANAVGLAAMGSRAAWHSISFCNFWLGVSKRFERLR
jgi:hypothetical protein